MACKNQPRVPLNNLLCAQKNIRNFSLAESLSALPRRSQYSEFCLKPAFGGTCRSIEPIVPKYNQNRCVPPNPCAPQPRGHDTWKSYKYFSLFVSLPVILAASLKVSKHKPDPKGECREYEYMLRRTKRFPWGNGAKSLFHNDHVNHLPGECRPPPIDCDFS